MKKKFYILLIFFIILLSILFENKNVVISDNTKISGDFSENANEISQKSGDIQDKYDDISQTSGDLKYTSEDNSSNSGENSTSKEPSSVSIKFDTVPETLQNFRYQIQPANNYSNNINLSGTSNYNNIKGISTFRGNNYRNNAFYGCLTINENKLQKIWTNTIGQTDNWTGVGWNGQPAIIMWDDDVKKQMNIYDEFKQKENFTEVIYGTLDSHIHFYDLDSGLPTRDSIKVESSIKGSVTIDPRGYPLLYVGQGINEVSGESVRFGYHIFSLIDGKELCFINGRDKFAYLGWGAFDGNPVIDSATDTMILPGENGIIYIVKLNTNYDKANAQISISPKITKYRYTQNGKAGGTENSITIYKNYAFFINNTGLLQCLDLNTLTPVWTYKMEDDCDATIGLEEENGELFLYAACEIDRRTQDDLAYIKKINGRTGKVIWEYSCACKYDASVNGGVLSSPIVGENNISDLVIYSISKTTSLRTGKLVALNKKDGTIAWEKDLTAYSWSSPVAAYTKSGEAYIIFADSYGIIHLINGKTGETLYTLQTRWWKFRRFTSNFLQPYNHRKQRKTYFQN